jgi:hypothetical protein
MKRRRKKNPSTLVWVGIAAGVGLAGYVAIRSGLGMVLAFWYGEIKNKLVGRDSPAP